MENPPKGYGSAVENANREAYSTPCHFGRLASNKLFLDLRECFEF